MRRGLLAPLVTTVLVATVLPATLPALAAPGARPDAVTTVPAPAGVHDLVASDPAISSDGRWVAFVGEVDGASGLYRHDTLTGETEQVQTRRGRAEVAEIAEPSISDDGRWIAWTSLPDTPGSTAQVWVSDLRTDSTRLVSGTPEWEPGNGTSHQPVVSGDGQHVAFTTRATDVVSRPHWGAGSAPGSDVVVAQRVDEGFVVTLASSGEAGVDFGSPKINRDASRIAFTSGQGPHCRVQVVERPGGDWVWGVSSEVVTQRCPLPGDASAPVVSVDGGSVLYAHPRRRGHALLVDEVATGATRTIAERVDASAGFDLSADGDSAVHVLDGVLLLADLTLLPGSPEPVEAPRAVWNPLVQRSAAPARGPGYVLAVDPATWPEVPRGRVERQWLRDGRAIPGATGLTHELTAADMGREIAVRERLVAPGLPVGEVTSRAYRALPDRARLVVPQVLRTRAGAARVRVQVVTTPGSETYVAGSAVPQGMVKVRVRGRTVTRAVGADGWVSLRLPVQRPGRHVVRVQHVGTAYVTGAAAAKVRVVVRPRR